MIPHREERGNRLNDSKIKRGGWIERDKVRQRDGESKKRQTERER